MSVEFNIEGLDEVQKKLKALGNKNLSKRISRKAARQAMNIVRDAARQAAKNIDDPNTPEKIYKEIVVSAGRSRDSNSIVMRVGVRGELESHIPITQPIEDQAELVAPINLKERFGIGDLLSSGEALWMRARILRFLLMGRISSEDM